MPRAFTPVTGMALFPYSSLDSVLTFGWHESVCAEWRVRCLFNYLDKIENSIETKSAQDMAFMHLDTLSCGGKNFDWQKDATLRVGWARPWIDRRI